MNLIDEYKDFKLTNNQNQLVNKLTEFLNSNIHGFLLKGYAGTGKTFMLKGLVQYLYKNNHNVILLASTGRAARIISQSTTFSAATIHRHIYEKDKLSLIDSDNNNALEIFSYSLKEKCINSRSVYIVDEASLISDVYSQSSILRYGSGHLLQDFVSYLNLNVPSNQNKLIFVGDSAQLPPIMQSFSPALSAQYLYDKYQINAQEFELTEVVRQDLESAILKQAINLRESIRFGVFNQLSIEFKPNSVEKLLVNDFMTKYLELTNHKINPNTIVLAFSNSKVSFYNNQIRAHFFPNQKELQVGDKIIITKNNYTYDIELFNGMFASVKTVEATSEKRIIQLKEKDLNGNVQKKEIVLSFRNIEIKVFDADRKPRIIKCKIFENYLYSDNPEISIDEIKAMYIDLRIRNSKIKEIDSSFLEILKADEYFNSLFVKFGYALTCHKAQGGEWDNVILDCTSNSGYLNSNYFRWLYTAFTRAKKSINCINPPDISIIGKMKLPDKEILKSIKDSNLVINPSEFEDIMGYSLPTYNQETAGLHFVIQQLLTDLNISIINHRSLNYCEEYTFSFTNNNLIVQIFYNKTFKISAIKPQETSKMDFQKLLDRLTSIVNKTILIIDNNDLYSSNFKQFEFKEEFLKQLFDKVYYLLRSTDIIIQSIDHGQYYERYTFRQNGFTALFDFYYNSKKIFTKMRPNTNQSTSGELTENIINIFEDLKL